MNIGKRIAVGILLMVLLLGILPVTAIRTQAATANAYFDEIQCAEYPLNHLNIARTNTKLDPDQDSTKLNSSTSGHRAYAIDLNQGGAKGKQATDYKVYAPFDMEIKFIDNSSHSVYVESQRPVRFADGRVDYMTCVFIHDNKLNNLKVGQKFKQGDYFYDQGDYGNSTGIHVHIEVAAGRGYCTSKDYWTNLKKIRANGVQVNDAFFLSPTTTKSKTHIGYDGKKILLNWRTRQEVVFHSNVSGVADLVRHYPLNESFGSLPKPVNPGKEFVGWYTAKTGGSKVTDTTKVTSANSQLYARWKDDPVKFTNKVTMKAQSITQTNAELFVSVKLNSVTKAKKAGFYIGTNAKYLSKCSTDKTVNNSDLSKGVKFKINDYGFTLQPDTTYYYQFYAVVGSKEVYSDVASFRTSKATQTKKPEQTHVEWRKPNYSAITSNSATISATVQYKKDCHGQTAANVKVDRYGFYIGTSTNTLAKSSVYTSVNANKKSNAISYNLEKEGVSLKANTTYYYQFYVIIGGVEYKSGILSFKTKANSGGSATTKPEASTLNLSWSKYSATKITQTNASISASVNYGKTLKADKCGFYLGTAQNSLTKASKADTISQSRKYTDMWYDLNKYGFTLKPGTTYYYQFYIVISGKEYKSAVKSFTTQKPAAAPTLNLSWSKYKAASITKSNATISATVNYGKTLKADKCGFYLGTSQNSLTKASKADTISQSRKYTDMWYDLNKYGFTLKPGTTYYYQFYIVISGKEYKSAVKSFTTKPDTQGAPDITPETQPTAPKLSPTWSNYDVSGITQSNATIAARVTYGKKLKADACGFYLGTSQGNLEKAKKYDTITESRNLTDMWYDLNKYGYTLKPATTYYYRLYLMVDGQEYLSEIKSFTTAKAELSPVWSEYKVSNVTKTNATIAAKVTYGKTVKPEKCGFYIGTTEDNLAKAEKYDAINANRTYSGMSYGMNKYGYTLKAGTTYYYRFYVIVNGVEYLSDIKSFTTAK